MDSMRSLNTSLPKTRQQPDVHQSFRTAALTVTNLYKSALADLDRARVHGYQDALDELLGFLDKENIGLAEGEARRVRNWATERLDRSLRTRLSNSDSDEDEIDDKRARSSSPIMERNTSPEETRSATPFVEAIVRPDSAPPPLPMEVTTSEADAVPLHRVFEFSSPCAVSPSADAHDTAISETTSPARRAFPAPRRNANRSTSRTLQRSAAQNQLQLGNGAGQKRRLMQEYFNIDGFNDRRDGSPGGGPKRGRMS